MKSLNTIAFAIITIAIPIWLLCAKVDNRLPADQQSNNPATWKNQASRPADTVQASPLVHDIHLEWKPESLLKDVKIDLHMPPVTAPLTLPASRKDTLVVISIMPPDRRKDTVVVMHVYQSNNSNQVNQNKGQYPTKRVDSIDK